MNTRMIPTVMGIMLAGGLVLVSPHSRDAEPQQSAAIEQGWLSAQSRDFVTKAAKGNAGEILLGEMASQRAGSPQVQDHGAANERLKPIATAIDFDCPSTGKKQQLEIAEQLSSMSGPQFDQKYTQAMGARSSADAVAERLVG